ncbi:MAG: YCF48-related protein, partial [Bacteroidota bacterium]|nr:YCF48-related protein [Bacteroidota bacterium]
MKTTYRFVSIFFLTLILCAGSTHAQWVTQVNPLGSGENAMLGKIQFVSSAEGWAACSHSGALLHTTDAGNNWAVVNPFPDETTGNLSDPAKSMSWVNTSHGWAIKTYYSSGTNEESLSSCAQGAVIYHTVDGGTSWTKLALPKYIEPVTYQADNLVGNWKIHALTAKNPQKTTSASCWIVADGSVSQGMLSINGTKSDGNQFSRIMPIGVSSTGKVSVENSEVGFMSSDKNLIAITGYENDDAPALYIMQKQISSQTYNTSDLAGNWQLLGLSAGNSTGQLSGKLSAALTGDASGNLTGILKNGNGTSSISTQASISSTGVISGLTSTGSNANGFMSADKNTIFLTITGTDGTYNLFVFQKRVTGTNYSTADMTGCWQLHAVVADNISDQEPFSSWLKGTFYIKSDGSYTVSNMVVNESTMDEKSGSLSLTSDGYLSGFGPFNDGTGYLSIDKNFCVLTNTDGSGGFSFALLQRDRTICGDMGLQIQFTDEKNGWCSIYNAIYNNFSILKTTDGGTNWVKLTSAGNAVGGPYHFVDANNGWMIGSTDISEGNLANIYHTTNGGQSWSLQASNIGKANDLCFTDLSHGWVVGKNGLVLKTTDGGSTWIPVTNTNQDATANFKTVFFLNANTGWFGSEGSD